MSVIEAEPIVDVAIKSLYIALSLNDETEDFSLWRWLDGIQSSPHFSAASKEAAYALGTYCRNGAQICWPSLGQICEATGKGRTNSDRITGLLTPLVKAGWLEREKRYEGRRATFVYGIRLPTTQRRILDNLDIYEQIPGQFRSEHYFDHNSYTPH